MRRPRRPARGTVIATAFVALSAVAVASCSSATPASGRPAVHAADAALLPAAVDALPDMDPKGYAALLSQLRGTPVVVNVWASWCVPCRAEAPELAKAATEHGTQIQFVGIDVLDSRGDARGFIEEFGWTYPSLFDGPHAIPTSLGHSGQPVTFFYTADGALLRTIDGQMSAQELADGIASLLA